MTTAFLNRPMMDEDLSPIRRNPYALELRRMVAEYARQGLPVMNGGFEYSNLRDGPEQLVTCHPYRLWEYASLFDVWRPEAGKVVMDVGGAASPLCYFLAERGCDVTAIDLQPLLVNVCNEVARVRKLSLTAETADITSDPNRWVEKFDVITCISVLEHVPASARVKVIESIARALKPGGVFYLTFDYGDFVDQTDYTEAGGGHSAALREIESMCGQFDAAGLTFEGNDPRQLPAEILARKSSPGWTETARRFSLQLGPVDGATSWKRIAYYALRRLIRLPSSIPQVRFEHHNFFRMTLRKPSHV